MESPYSLIKAWARRPGTRNPVIHIEIIPTHPRI